MRLWRKIGKPILEWAEHIHFLWSIPFNAALAAVVGYWALVTDWISRYGYLPVFLISLFVFTVGIWAWNGIVWMLRQRRPSKARIAFDYSYALTIIDVLPSLDLGNLTNTLELRLQVGNTANGPFVFEVEKLEFRIKDRFVTARPRGAVISRSSSLTVFPGAGFNRTAWDSFEERPTGTIEFSIIYGHPEDEKSRRATKTIAIDLFKKNDGRDVSLNWRVLSENDVPIRT